MKNFLFTALAVVAVSVSAVAGGKEKAANTTYKVDAGASKIKWVGKKVTGEHAGYVSFKSGTVSYDGKNVTVGNAVVDMNSITCSDLEAAKGGDKLVGHLKNADFFDVEQHPTAEFKLTSVVPAKDGDNTHKVKGTLTIKGVTNAVEFPARIEVKDKTLVLRADVTFDRTKYGIKYGSASVMEGLGDKAIYDDVLFSLALVARTN
ncbi:MAG: YceI family protein [Bacteroidota bacterium]